jgi:hypothetical protein
VDVEGDDGDQHDEPAGEGEEQELHGGILATRPAELADEEVDRDEHRLEEDVEQEDVGRREDSDHEGLERRASARSSARSRRPPRLGQVVPGGQDADRGEDDRHEDEGQGDAVDTQA